MKIALFALFDIPRLNEIINKAERPERQLDWRNVGLVTNLLPGHEKCSCPSSLSFIREKDARSASSAISRNDDNPRQLTMPPSFATLSRVIRWLAVWINHCYAIFDFESM
jgi:hypothetical protein